MKYVFISLGVIILAVLGYVGYAYYLRYDTIDLPDKALIEEVYVERLADGSYIIEFAKKDSFQIYQGTTVDNIDWSRPIATTSDAAIRFDNYNFSDRYFFGIKNSKGEKLIASERLIPMEGADNFRDLGGIPTKDGRALKWGMFYRSGKLNKLSPKDLAYYRTLKLKTVVDFRDDREIAKDPSRFPDNYTVNTVRVPIGDKSGNIQEKLKEQIRKADAKTFDGKKFVQDVNRQFIDTFAFQYKPFLDLATNPENTPLVFHCSAGKDRTGLATALLLSVLGVDKEVILGDFMMSNYYKNESINRTIRKASVAGISQRISRPLVEVDETYLAAAFTAIDDKYGSVDSFLVKEYGFTDEQFRYIRNTFLMSNDENVEVVELDEDLDINALIDTTDKDDIKLEKVQFQNPQ